MTPEEFRAAGHELIDWIAVHALHDRLQPGEADQGHHLPKTMNLQDAIKAIAEPAGLTGERHDLRMEGALRAGRPQRAGWGIQGFDLLELERWLLLDA